MNKVMQKTKSRFGNRLTRFHQEEEGMESLQVVLITAVAAVILAVFVRLWPEIRDWARDAIDWIMLFDEEA